MFGSRKSFAIACASALLLGAGVANAEKVKNPEYESWAKCKAGAMVKSETTSDSAGQKAKTTTTTKLLEINADKAVVEVAMSIEAANMPKMDMPASKREIPATIDNAAVPPSVAPQNTPPAQKPDVKEGEETLTIGGKEVKCKTTESNTESGGMKVHAKTWTSTEVPTFTVKMEAKTTGVAESSSSMQVVEFSTGK